MRVARILKKILKVVIKHKIVAFPVIILYVAVTILGVFGNTKHIAGLSGENDYYFDNIGHIKVILNGFINDPRELTVTNTPMPNAVNYYTLSKWCSLSGLLFLSVLNIFKINNYIFYLFLNISIQLIALYVFCRLFFIEQTRAVNLLGNGC